MPIVPFIPAIAGVAGAAIGASATNKAAQQGAAASQQATDATIAEQRRQFDIGQQNQQPWLTTGNSALNQLAGLYGLNTQPGGANASTYAYLQANPEAQTAINNGYFGGPGNLDAAANFHRNQYGGAQQNAGNVTAGGYSTANGGGAAPATQVGAGGNGAMNAFFASPDYQFRQDESMRALTARNAALGIQDSGAAQRSALQLSGNLASGEFNNYANRLSSLAGVGQTAAQNTAAAGQSFANSMGQVLGNNAQNLASSYATQGANNASLWSGIGGAVGAGVNQYIGRRP